MLVFPRRRCRSGKVEFPIVKDTTPNMMNPRLYTTSYDKRKDSNLTLLSFLL